jgi:hypothetical protein
MTAVNPWLVVKHKRKNAPPCCSDVVARHACMLLTTGQRLGQMWVMWTAMLYVEAYAWLFVHTNMRAATLMPLCSFAEKEVL